MSAVIHSTHQCMNSKGPMNLGRRCLSLIWGGSMILASCSSDPGFEEPAPNPPTSIDSVTSGLSFAEPSSSYVNSLTADLVSVGGLCESAGAKIDLFLNSQQTPSATTSCAPNKTWTASVDLSSFPDGSIVMKAAFQFDPSRAVARTFTKDTMSPAITIVSPAANFVVNLTNQSAFSVSGTCSNGDGTVVINVGNLPAVSVACMAASFTYTVNLESLAQGALNISVLQVDAAGNADSDQRLGLKDSIAPQVSMDFSSLIPSPSRLTSARTLNITGAEVSHYQAVVLAAGTCSGANFANVTEAPIGTPFTFTPTNNSSNVVCARGRDLAGNYQAVPTASSVLVIDTTAPVVAWTQPLPTFSINAANQNQPVTLAGTCTAGDTAVRISWNGPGTALDVNCANNGTFNTTRVFQDQPDGYISLDARQSDVAGNESAQAVRTILKDLAAPTLTVNQMSEIQVTCSGFPALKLDGDCSEPNRPVTITSGQLTRTPLCNSGKWSVGEDFFYALPTGTGTISVSHSDVAGNTTTQMRSYNRMESPTMITTVQGLIAIRDDRDGCYHLGQDIDLGTYGWTLDNSSDLGDTDTPFKGTLNGRGYKIKNLNSPSSFISVMEGGTISNVIFEDAKLGLTTQTGGEGLAKQARAEWALPPKTSKFLNVHMVRGEIHSGSEGLLGAGAFASEANGLEIIDSTADVKFVTNHHLIQGLGGFIGELKTSGANTIGITNSKTRVEVTYTDAAALAADSPSVRDLGGLIGGVLYSSALFHNLRIERSAADFKFHPTTTKPKVKLDRIGGLIGGYEQPTGSSSCATSLICLLSVLESTAKVDFDFNLPANWETSSFLYASGLLGQAKTSAMANTSTRVMKIEDSYVEGRMEVSGGGNNQNKVLAGVGRNTINHNYAPFNIQRTYSTVEFFSGFGSSSRAFWVNPGSGLGAQPASRIYNTTLDLNMTASLSATAKTTSEMQDAGTWTAQVVGFSEAIWLISNGSFPSLKRITVQYPPSN